MVHLTLLLLTFVNSILWSTRDGTKASSSITATHDPSGDDTGSGMFGSTYYYGYSIPFSSSVGISSFGPSNEFAVSDEVFWVVPLSSVSVNEDLSAHLDYNLTVAVSALITFSENPLTIPVSLVHCLITYSSQGPFLHPTIRRISHHHRAESGSRNGQSAVR